MKDNKEFMKLLMAGKNLNNDSSDDEANLDPDFIYKNIEDPTKLFTPKE